VSILSIYTFLFNILQKKSSCVNLLNWKNYSQFKIAYSLTLLDLVYLLVDENVRLDDNIKSRWWKHCLRRYDNMLRKRMTSMHFKQTKDEKGLSLN
jgi:hypothetical protein